MAKTKKSTTGGSPQVVKINIPGVNISELLELESLIPDLRKHLATITLVSCIIAQIRSSLIKALPREVEALESVNYHIRNGLSKSLPMRYVAAGVAIRKTMFKYVDDPDGSGIVRDHTDLVENPTGEASTKGGPKAASVSPERLRKYRRGIMLQVVGAVQAATIHSPLKFHREIGQISDTTFMESLPFDTTGFNLAELYQFLRDYLRKDGNKIIFVDTLSLDMVPLEKPLRLDFERQFPEFSLKESKIPVDESKLPKHIQLAYKQIKSFKEG